MYSCYNGFYMCNAPSFDKTLSVDSRAYWERSFFQRIRALIKVKGLPEAGPGQIGWDYDAYMYQLLAMGYTPIFRSKKYGMVVQPGFPSGYGLQFQPRGMSISTPFFHFERPLEIGKECAVIKLTPDYRGIWDIISKYAAELQQLEIAIRQASINARFGYAAIAKNDKDKRSLEAIFERMQNGQPGIVINANLTEPNGLTAARQETTLPIMQFDRDLSKNFILPELYEVRRQIITDFYKELGVDVKMNVSLTPYNAADMEKIYAAAEKLGTPMQLATYMFPPTRRDEKLIGQNDRFSAKEAAEYGVEWDKLRFTDEQFLKRAEAMRDGLCLPAEDVCDGAPGEGILCRAGRSSFWINWQGDMTPCGMMTEPAFSVPELGFDEAWARTKSAAAAIRLPSDCVSCKYKNACHACAAMCVTETGKFDKRPDYVCEMTRESVRLTLDEYEKRKKNED